MIIGITGGTGAGKTTALNAVQSLGGYVIDCDEVYHKLLSKSEHMKMDINSHFPGTLKNGTLDRHKLGEQVFSSEHALELLNSITHPYVVQEVKNLIKIEVGGGQTLFAIDAIALFECGLADICDVTVYVTAPREKRAERIVKREGISYEYAIMRINAQKSESFFTERCTYVLLNDFESEKSFGEYCIGFFKNITRRD